MKKRIESLSVRKGAWSNVEDELLRACVRQYGEGKWHLVPSRAGLKRCRKSCRLRWLNYLKPNIKRGVFAEDEVDLIIRLHTLLGNRWSLIAGRLPGRTPNDVKNYWNTYLRRKLASSNYKENHKNIANAEEIKVKPHVVIKPQPRTFSSRISTWLRQRSLILSEDIESGAKQCSTTTQACEPNLSKYNNCWGNVTEDKGGGNDKCNNNWDDEELASLTQHVGDYLIDGPSWNDFHLDVNLWDS